MLSRHWKIILIAILLVAAVWMTKRNLSAPIRPIAANPGAGESGRTSAQNRPAAKPQKGPAIVAQVDPTLRLDLLEAARGVEYKGASRNIFEVYTPPPPPTPPKPPTVTPPVAVQPTTPATPPKPDVPLKFYGIAQPAGTNAKHAFLTDGEEIMIAKEGDIVGKYYKVNRIGITSMELEDTRTKKASLLPLEE